MRDLSTLADSLYGAPPSAIPAPPSAAAPAAPVPAQASPVASPVASPAPPVSEAVPAAAPAAGVPAESHEQLTAEAFVNAVPESVRQERAETSRKLYGGDAELAKVMPDEMFKVDGVAPEVQATVAAEVRAMAGDIGLLPADVGNIREALAAAREAPMTDEQRGTAGAEIIDALNAKYGQGAKQALLDARKFVSADPRRAAMLSPIGNDPRTVLRIVELAQGAKRAGRLR